MTTRDTPEAAMAAALRRVGCEVNVDQIAYYLVREGVRANAEAEIAWLTAGLQSVCDVGDLASVAVASATLKVKP